jgi:hypothetical protein
MRTAATGFFLGYVVVALLIAPTLLCAFGATSDYSAAVVTVLSRTGVLEATRRGAREAVEIRDHVELVVNDFLDRRIGPHLTPSQD